MTSAPPSFGAQPNLNRSFFILDITSLTRVNLDRQSFIADLFNRVDRPRAPRLAS